MVDNSAQSHPKVLQHLEERVASLSARSAHLEEEIAWRRLLMEQSRDSLVVVDQEARVHEANRRFAEMLGYTVEEVIRLHVWDWDAVHTREQILHLAGTVDEKGHCFETIMRRKDGTLVEVELCNNGAFVGERKLILCVCRDISARKRAQREKEELIRSLQDSLAEIKTLRGILPLCSLCKKVRDDEGFWEQVDIYLTKHSSADITYGLCPDCLRGNNPDQGAEPADA